MAFAGDVVGEELSLDGTRVPLDRLEEAVDSTAATGAIETMSLWAGESVGGVKGVQPAAGIRPDLAGGAELLLRRLGNSHQ